MVLQEAVARLIQSSFLAFPPSTLVKQAINTMAEARASCTLVIEDQKLLGILTERDVVRITTSTVLAETLTLAEVMTRNVITTTIFETQEIFPLSRMLSRNRIRHLPVLDEQNHVVGIVTPQSIRNLLKPEYLLRYVRVNDVMQKHVICGSPDSTVLVIAQQMASHRVSCVVITENQTSFPIGIITERDIVKFHQLGLDFPQTFALNVMSAPLFTMHPQDSLWGVHQKMQELNVRRLVMTHPTGELAGIVTQSQMLKMLDPTEMYHVMEQMQEIIDRQTNELQELNQKLQLANKELAHISTIDELTQIVNRRRFNEFLYREWERLSNTDQPLSLIMCDVDRFKSYNDIYGHLAGDECLVKIAKVLRGATRQVSDLVARFGGEEFALILPNTNIDGVTRVVEDILKRIQNLHIPHALPNSPGFVTVSLGAATIVPNQNSSPELLLQGADQLLYRAKQKGRNTYTLKVLENNA
ncbi:MAG: diguanylate cyclase [Cyanobacteria bacterium J06638_22]